MTFMKSNSRDIKRFSVWAVGGLVSLMMAIPGFGQVSPPPSAGPITIKDATYDGTTTTPSKADPYPSEITVTGVAGNLEKVTVTLNGLTHPYPDDVNVLLVTPAGKKVLLMSHAGGSSPLSGATVTFEAGKGSLPNDTQISSGSYAPTGYGTPLDFSTVGGGPGGAPYTDALGSLAGVSPNGKWQLYVVDDSYTSSGSIDSWQLNFWVTPTIQVEGLVAGATNMLENIAKQLTVTVGSPSTPLNTLKVTAVSDTQLVVNNTNLVVTGTGATRTLTILNQLNQYGPLNLTVTVDDTQGAANSTKSVVVPFTVIHTNQPPTIALETDAFKDAAKGKTNTVAGVPVNVTATLADVDDVFAAQTLTLSATSSNPSVIAAKDVFFSSTTGPSGTRTVTIAPSGAATGVAVVTVTVTDQGSWNGTAWIETKSATATVEVTVTQSYEPLFANTGTITVADNTSADPYPSTITVSGLSGGIARMHVTLANVTHPSPQDLGVLLVGPKGQKVVLMNASSGTAAVSHARLDFADELSGKPLITTAPAIVSGTYSAGNNLPAYNFPGSAPAGPYSAAGLQSFFGTDPNGTWSLYVVDRAAPGAGLIESGWFLSLWPAPSISPSTLPALETDEDVSKSVTVTVADYMDPSYTPVVTASSDNPGLVVVTVTTNLNNATIQLAPKLNQNGTANITVSAVNKGGNIATSTFVLTVKPVNDAPTITFIPKQITRAGTPTAPVPFTVGDVETPAGSLTVTATSNNPKLLPDGNIILTHVGGAYTMNLFPVGILKDAAVVTVTVTDNGADSSAGAASQTVTQQFTVTAEDPSVPTFANANFILQTTNNAPADTYPSKINVAGLVGKVIDVSVTVSGIAWPTNTVQDLAMLLVGPKGQKVVLMSNTGAGAGSALNNGQLLFQDAAAASLPAAGPIASGAYKPTALAPVPAFPSTPSGLIDPTLATFAGTDPNGDWSLYVMDAPDGLGNNTHGAQITGGWMLSIHTTPKIGAVPDQITDEDVPLRVGLTIGDSQPGKTASIIVTATSSNPTLVPNTAANLAISGSGSSRSLVITPALNQNSTLSGTANITVSVTDTTTETVTFKLTVNAVNDPPTITDIADQSTFLTVPVGPIPFTVADVESAATAITVTASTDNPSVVPLGNITLGGTGGARTITIQPAGIARGVARITLTADDGALKTSKSFNVTVNANLSFANLDPIVIVDRGGTDSAPAPGRPYPSTINVSGVDGFLGSATVTLVGFRHGFPSDVDIVLVSPDNKAVKLMGGAGGGNSVSNLRLTFSSAAAADIPNAGPLTSGTYKPAKYGTSTAPVNASMPSPAPAGPYSVDLTSLRGINPNGVWSLFVDDNTYTLDGAIDGGWIVTFEMGPVIPAIPAQLLSENIEKIVPFTILDSSDSATNLTVLATSLPGTAANQIPLTLLTNNDTNGYTRTVKITPALNKFGTNLVTLRVTDSKIPGNWSETSFPVTVGYVDQVPIVGTATNHVYVAENGSVTINYTFTDVEWTPGSANPLGVTNVTVTSDNPALVPNSTNNIIITEANSGDPHKAVNVLLKPTANATGDANLTFTLRDAVNTVTTNVTLTVSFVNQAPSIAFADTNGVFNVHAYTNSPNLIAGGSSAIIPFKVGDVETPAKALVVSKATSAANIIPLENIILGGGNENRSIQVTAVGEAVGHVIITLTVKDDDATNQKTDTATFDVTVVAAPGSNQANQTAIIIPDMSKASVYPSTITFAGLAPAVSRVLVTVDGFSHTAPDDVSMLLVGPAGQKVTLLSRVGGRVPVSNARLTFDDSAARLDHGAPILSGTYAPSDYGIGIVYPSPAPAAPYAATLSAFNGSNPNGAWSLYVQDSQAGDAGQIAFGWSLHIDTLPTISVVGVTPPVVMGVTPALVVVEETSTPVTLLLSTGNPSDTDASKLLVSVSSDNPRLFPDGSVTFGAIGAATTATISPAANTWTPDGVTNLLTFTVMRAGDRASASASLPIRVTFKNHLPVIARLIDRTTVEDVKSSFDTVVSDIDTAVTDLHITAVSSNQGVISNTNILLFGYTNDVVSMPANVFNVVLQPNKNAFGTAVITFTVTDKLGGPAVSSSFNFTVTQVNYAPTISLVDPVPSAITAGGTVKVVMNITDPESATESYTITATSSDTNLVKNANISLPGVVVQGTNNVAIIQAEPTVKGPTTITFTVKDNGTPVASATTSLLLNVRPTREQLFTTTSPVIINDASKATPYPSVLNVSGLVGTVTHVSVTLNGFAHEYPSDVNMVLVSPDGKAAAFMSKAGAGTGVTGLTLKFDDNAVTPVPQGPLTSQTYKPANYAGTKSLPTPAPAAPTGGYPSALSTLNGSPASGDWLLYIIDDTAGQKGSLAGWSLAITTQPTLTGLADITTPENVPQRVTFVVSEESFASQVFADWKFTYTSTNTALINATTGVAFSGTLANCVATVTPSKDVNGVSQVTITATNPDGQSVSGSFKVTVTSVDQFPTVSAVANQTINAGGAVVVAFDYSDPETAHKDLIVTVESSNATLIPVGNVAVLTSSIQVVPAGNQTGTSTITISVKDSADQITKSAFAVTVLPAQNPLFANSDPITIVDNNTARPYPSTITVAGVHGTVTKATVTLIGLSHPFPDDIQMMLAGPGGTKSVVLMANVGGGGANQVLSNVRLTFDDAAAASIPDASAIVSGSYKPTQFPPVSFPAPAPSAPGGTLSVFNGQAPNGTWSLYVLDDTAPDAGSISGGWLLSLETTAPTISAIADQILDEDSAPKAITFQVGDPNTDPATLVTRVTVVPDTFLSAAISGTGTSRTLTLTPKPLQVGVSTVTVSVSDDGGATTTDTSFQVTINPINHAPTIVGLANISVASNVSSTMSFTVADVETAAGLLVVTASSADEHVATATLTDNANGAWSLVLTPAPAAAVGSSTTINVAVTDGVNTTHGSLVATIAAPLLPVITGLTDRTINQDSALEEAFSISTTSTATLNVTGDASNKALVSGVTIIGTGKSRTAVVRLVPLQSGISTITISVDDGFGIGTATFNLTVLKVEHPPVLGPIADQTTREDIAVNLPLDVTDVDTALGSLTFDYRTSNSGLVKSVTFSTAGGTVVATINLVPLKSGVAVVTIFVGDGTSVVQQSFALTVTPFNYAPTLGAIPDQTTQEDVALTVPIPVSDLDTAISSLVFSAASTDDALVKSVVFSVTGSDVVAKITPGANLSGSATIVVTVVDSLTNKVSTPFVLTVTPVNDPPTIGAVPAQTTPKDVALVVPLTVSDVESATSALEFTSTNSNPAVLGEVTFAVTPTNVLATVTPALHATGTGTVTLFVSDGTNIVSTSFELTVTPFDYPPTLGVIGDQRIREDVALNLPIAVSDIETPTEALLVTATSSVSGLLKPITFSVTSTGVIATIDPVLHASGVTIITVAVSDGTHTVTQNFQLTVIQVNYEPQFDAIADQTTREDRALAIPLVVSDVETANSDLVYTAESSNEALLKGVTFSFNGNNVVATVTPALHAFGSTIMTIGVSDGNSTVTRRFNLTVLWVNYPPVVGLIDNATTAEDEPVNVLFDVSDIETPNSGLTYTASASKSLVSDVKFVASAGQVMATITPALHASGSGAVTFMVSDGTNMVTTAFLLTVTQVNYAPTLEPIADLTTLEDVALTIPLMVSDIETATTNLVLTGTSDKPALIKSVEFAVAGTNVLATITPTLHGFGSATITITVSDGTNDVSRQFALKVTEVNYPPVLAEIPNQATFEGLAFDVPLDVSDVETATDQLLFGSTNSNPALIGDVTFAVTGSSVVATVNPKALAFGKATATISVSDGVNTTKREFSVTVARTFYPPTLGPIANHSTAQGIALSIPLVVADRDTAIGDLVFSANSSNPSLISSVTFNVTGNDVVAVFAPTPGVTGTALLSVTVSDGLNSTSQAFTLMVGGAAQAKLTSRIVGSNFAVTITGTPGTTYLVQKTTDFVTWTDITTVTISADGTAVVSTSVVGTKLFIRAKQQ